VSFDLSDYVDVSERERLLFERYPDSRVQVELEPVRNAAGELIAWAAKATIWRTPEDPIPVIDWAVEPVPGKTPYTRDSEAMNASTSAVGRAIVLAGFPSKKIASADEVRARSGAGNGRERKPESDSRDEAGSTDAHPAPEVSTPPEDAKPSEYPVHFGKNRGVLLGSLTSAQLKWYADQWQVQENPTDYDRRLKAAAVALNSGNDTPLVPAGAVVLSPHDDEIPFA